MSKTLVEIDEQVFEVVNPEELKLNSSIQPQQPSNKVNDEINTIGDRIGSDSELEHSIEDEERWNRLFRKLDHDNNGKIDIHDLSMALQETDIGRQYAQKFIEKSDKTKSGHISLADFIYHVKEHEKNLRLQFSQMDSNKDGQIDMDELLHAFHDLGIDLSREEGESLLKRIDKDGSLSISFDEWRDFLLLAPEHDIRGLLKFWRHSTILDVGEDMYVPDDFTQTEMSSGMWWRHLVAGGVAGAASRTCTAPLDRVKVFLQVHSDKVKISKCLRNLIVEGGILSLWRGNGVNILKIAPETALKFSAYEQSKRFLLNKQKDPSISTLTLQERFCAGAMAGSFSQTMIYPLEVLKTRLALRKTGQYYGIMDAIRKIYQTRGLRSFYRGYVPNIIGIIPYGGIDLAVYETLKREYLKNHSMTEQTPVFVILACGSISSSLGQICSYPLTLIRTRLQASDSCDRQSLLNVAKYIVQKDGVAGLYRGILPNFIKVLPAVSISYAVYEYASQLLNIEMS